MKFYLIVPLFAIIVFIASLQKPTIPLTSQDFDAFRIFISVLGIVFSIIVGFTIANVWGEFVNISGSIKKESSSLRNIYLLSLHLSSKRVSESLKQIIPRYIVMSIQSYWGSSHPRAKETEEDFVKISQTFEDFVPKNQKDVIIIEDVLEELRNISVNRDNIQSLALAFTPKILWVLLLFFSAILVVAFFLLTVGDRIFASLTTSLASSAIALVLFVIYDMDYPFRQGFWEVSPKSYFDVENFVKTH